MSLTPTEARCATLLRELRRKRGITLNEFEAFSNGSVKAVVLGSYERATRAISLARLEQLANIYEVPLEYFFSASQGSDLNRNQKSQAGYIFDIRRINRMEGLAPELMHIRKYLSAIAHKRRDWNGEVLSIRASDGENLALMGEIGGDELTSLMRLNGFLISNGSPNETTNEL